MTAPALRNPKVPRPDPKNIKAPDTDAAPGALTPPASGQPTSNDCPANPAKGSPPVPGLVPGSTTLMLSGDLLVDLEQIDSVDIVATVVNASGKPFDDRQRGAGCSPSATDIGREQPRRPSSENRYQSRVCWASRSMPMERPGC